MEDTIKIELLTPLTGTFLPNEMEQDWEGEEYHELEEDVYKRQVCIYAYRSQLCLRR